MIFDFFGFKKGSPGLTSETSKLFNLVYGLIVDKNKVQDIWDRYARANSDELLARSFSEMEKFIIDNNPPVVTKDFDKSGLYNLIQMGIETKLLPIHLRLFFLPSDQMFYPVFYIASKSLTDILSRNLGNEKLQQITAELLSGTGMTELSEKQFTNFSKSAPQIQVINTARKVYKGFFNAVVSNFGEKTALEEVQKSFEFFKGAYDKSVVLILFDFLPEGVLTSERIDYLSREQLEERITMATASERKKAEEAQALSEKLAQTVKSLEEQKTHLEKLNSIMVGRELEMRELKKQTECANQTHQTLPLRDETTRLS